MSSLSLDVFKPGDHCQGYSRVPALGDGLERMISEFSSANFWFCLFFFFLIHLGGRLIF